MITDGTQVVLRTLVCLDCKRSDEYEIEVSPKGSRRRLVCGYCGHRVFLKQRPPVIKKLRAE